MISYETYEIPFSSPKEASSLSLKLKADFLRAAENRKNKTVLYFHGGGLLCGGRRDLPSVYQTMFLNNGYDLLAFDYPLAPEYSVSSIRKACLFCAGWFLDHYSDILGLSSSDYFLFGRSAGAYLSVMTAASVCGTKEVPQAYKKPLGLLLFYGYYSLLVPEFAKENGYYKSSFPPVRREDALLAAENSPIFDMPNSPRMLLYIYARQTGEWTSFLGSDEDLTASSLSEEELRSLPPAFLTASSMDQDVPFGISKRMSRLIPGSRFFPVYNLEHDFDRDTAKAEGRQAYEECFRWMESVL